MLLIVGTIEEFLAYVRDNNLDRSETHHIAEPHQIQNFSSDTKVLVLSEDNSDVIEAVKEKFEGITYV